MSGRWLRMWHGRMVLFDGTAVCALGDPAVPTSTSGALGH